MDRSTMTYKSGSQTDSMTLRGNIAIVSASLASGDDPDLREASPWRSDSWSCQLLTALLCDIILPCATDLGWCHCRCRCRCPRTTSVVTASLRRIMAAAMLGNHSFERLWFVCFVFSKLAFASLFMICDEVCFIALVVGLLDKSTQPFNQKPELGFYLSPSSLIVQIYKLTIHSKSNLAIVVGYTRGLT